MFFLYVNYKIVKVTNTHEQAVLWADLLSPVDDFYINELSLESFHVFSDSEMRKILVLAGRENYSKGDREALFASMYVLVKDMEVDDRREGDLRAEVMLKPVPKPQPRKMEPSTPKPTKPRTQAGTSSGGSTQETRNGIKRPRDGSQISDWWLLFSDYKDETGEVPSKVNLVQRAIDAGLDPNKSTLSCQLRAWKIFHDL